MGQTLKNKLADMGLVFVGVCVVILFGCFTALAVGMTLSAFGVI